MVTARIATDGLQHGDDRTGVERLAQVCVERVTLAHRKAAHPDKARLRAARPRLRHHDRAVDIREHDVAEDRVYRRRLEVSQSLRAVLRERNEDAAGAEKLAQDLTRVFIVIDK